MTLVSPSGLDLMQVSGFCIVADKLNFLRYMSHFRSVHRGQFLSLAKVSSPISNESQSSSNLRNEVLFWIHRQTAQRILGPVRKVPDSGGVSLALATAKKILTVGIQFLTVGNS